MAYEIFSRKVRRTGTPQVAFVRNGRLSFNKAATQLLQEQAVENVLLLWDSAARKVAIRPIAKKDPRSYKVHFGKRDNAAGFSAVTFMEHVGVDYEKATQSFDVSWNPEQGIFEIDLNKSQVKVRQPLLSAVPGR